MTKKPILAGKSIKDLQIELEELLAWFEDPDIDLDEATGKYEQALLIVKQLQSRLVDSQNKIELIRKKFSD